MPLILTMYDLVFSKNIIVSILFWWESKLQSTNIIKVKSNVDEEAKATRRTVFVKIVILVTSTLYAIIWHVFMLNLEENSKLGQKSLKFVLSEILI